MNPTVAMHQGSRTERSSLAQERRKILGRRDGIKGKNTGLNSLKQERTTLEQT